MTTEEIANKLVEYCREGRYDKCYEELYSPNAVSIEPKGAMMERAEGMEAITEKGRQFQAMVEETHGGWTGDPVVCGNHFSCAMTMDATFKGGGREKLEEVCVYEVADGKIVKEQFFYEVKPQ